MHSIYSDGGWRSFFRGNGANVLKIAPESALKFWAFDTLKSSIAKDSNAPTSVERLMAGSAAGVIAQVGHVVFNGCLANLYVLDWSLLRFQSRWLKHYLQ